MNWFTGGVWNIQNFVMITAPGEAQAVTDRLQINGKQEDDKPALAKKSAVKTAKGTAGDTTHKSNPPAKPSRTDHKPTIDDTKARKEQVAPCYSLCVASHNVRSLKAAAKKFAPGKGGTTTASAIEAKLSSYAADVVACQEVHLEEAELARLLPQLHSWTIIQGPRDKELPAYGLLLAFKESPHKHSISVSTPAEIAALATPFFLAARLTVEPRKPKHPFVLNVATVHLRHHSGRGDARRKIDVEDTSNRIYQWLDHCCARADEYTLLVGDFNTEPPLQPHLQEIGLQGEPLQRHDIPLPPLAFPENPTDLQSVVRDIQHDFGLQDLGSFAGWLHTFASADQKAKKRYDLAFGGVHDDIRARLTPDAESPAKSFTDHRPIKVYLVLPRVATTKKPTSIPRRIQEMDSFRNHFLELVKEGIRPILDRQHPAPRLAGMLALAGNAAETAYKSLSEEDRLGPDISSEFDRRFLSREPDLGLSANQEWYELRDLLRNLDKPKKRSPVSLELTRSRAPGLGEVVMAPHEVAEIFADHYQAISTTTKKMRAKADIPLPEPSRTNPLHPRERKQLEDTPETRSLADPITISELCSALRRADTSKALGDKDCPPLLWFYIVDDQALGTVLLKELNSCWTDKSWPPEFLRATVVPIHKTGKPRSDPASYRPISLLPALRKALGRIIQERLMRFEHLLLEDDQYAYRHGRSTAEALWLCQQSIEEATTYKKPLGIILKDLTKAFDTLDRRAIRLGLLHRGAPPQFTEQVMALYDDSTSLAVRQGGVLSTPRVTDRGVPQGDPLAALLFILPWDLVGRRALDYTKTEGWRWIEVPDGHPVEPLVSTTYADDRQRYLGKLTPSELLLVNQDTVEAARMGVHTNAEKTQFLYSDFSSRKASTRHSLRLGNQNVLTTLSGTMLGMTVDLTTGGQVNVDCVRARMGRCLGKIRQLLRLGQSHILPDHRKGMVLSLVTPSALYGATSAYATGAQLRSLSAIYMSGVRTALGISRLEKRRNSDVLTQHGLQPFVSLWRSAFVTLILRLLATNTQAHRVYVAKSKYFDEGHNRKPHGWWANRHRVLEDLRRQGITGLDITLLTATGEANAELKRALLACSEEDLESLRQEEALRHAKRVPQGMELHEPRRLTLNPPNAPRTPPSMPSEAEPATGDKATTGTPLAIDTDVNQEGSSGHAAEAEDNGQPGKRAGETLPEAPAKRPRVSLLDKLSTKPPSLEEILWYGLNPEDHQDAATAFLRLRVLYSHARSKWKDGLPIHCMDCGHRGVPKAFNKGGHRGILYRSVFPRGPQTTHQVPNCPGGLHCTRVPCCGLTFGECSCNEEALKSALDHSQITREALSTFWSASYKSAPKIKVTLAAQDASNQDDDHRTGFTN